MKVLVTGANGFVGRHLVSHLLACGDNVMALGQQADSPFDNRVNYRAIDLMDRAQASTIGWDGVETVYHLAGLAAVGPSFKNPQVYMDVNTGIQENLFDATATLDNPPRFVIISTGNVYDPKATLPLTEASEVSPASPYAASKLKQEELAIKRNQDGYDVVIARPFNHIGPGQSEGFLIPDLVKQLTASSDAILVGNLSAERDYTDVRDIVRAYRLMALSRNPSPIYNVCTGRPVSGAEILDRLIKLTGKTYKVSADPSRMRPSDTPRVYGSFARLHRETGWEPQIALDHTLRDIMEDSLT